MEIIKRASASETSTPSDILAIDTIRGPELTSQEREIVSVLMSKSTEGIDHFIPDDIDVETLLS